MAEFDTIIKGGTVVDGTRVQKAEDYRWLMVNGQVTFEDGRCTGATPGKLLRFGRGN